MVLILAPYARGLSLGFYKLINHMLSSGIWLCREMIDVTNTI